MFFRTKKTDNGFRFISQAFEDEFRTPALLGYHQILNIGNNDPVSLRRFISAIELCCGVKAKERNLPMQQGDVYTTYADIDRLHNLVGFKPKTKIEDGIKIFVDWYIQFYGQ